MKTYRLIENTFKTNNDWKKTYRLQDRQKRTDRDSLLQGVELSQQVHVAEESLLEALELPSEPVPHGHTDMEFPGPENREGEAVIRRRRCARTQVSREDSGGDAGLLLSLLHLTDLSQRINHRAGRHTNHRHLNVKCVASPSLNLLATHSYGGNGIVQHLDRPLKSEKAPCKNVNNV